MDRVELRFKSIEMLVNDMIDDTPSSYDDPRMSNLTRLGDFIGQLFQLKSAVDHRHVGLTNFLAAGGATIAMDGCKGTDCCTWDDAITGPWAVRHSQMKKVQAALAAQIPGVPGQIWIVKGIESPWNRIVIQRMEPYKYGVFYHCARVHENGVEEYTDYLTYGSDRMPCFMEMGRPANNI